jgi:hypothetical protein
MGGFKRRDGGVQATRAPRIGQLLDSNGRRVKPGHWLVVENGRESVMSNEDFQAEFQSSDTALVPHQEQRVAPGRQESRGDLDQGRGAGGGRRRVVEGENGMAKLADGLFGLVSQAFSGQHKIAAAEYRDDKGNVVARNTQDIIVQVPGRPDMTEMVVNERGEVTGVKVKTEEWPPRAQNEKW